MGWCCASTPSAPPRNTPLYCVIACRYSSNTSNANICCRWSGGGRQYLLERCLLCLCFVLVLGPCSYYKILFLILSLFQLSCSCALLFRCSLFSKYFLNFVHFTFVASSPLQDLSCLAGRYRFQQRSKPCSFCQLPFCPFDSTSYFALGKSAHRFQKLIVG